ncbi:MAG: Asp-tRNA(Asn)/Glu-tRNA(Gln) amidotransferase subunit GatC [Chloroflexota bacterium]|nr:Asp-tRNA(Asn)/Glu-tRNA(Gln) amidotransferase subunit GatC [Chloroflexota bacterium]
MALTAAEVDHVAELARLGLSLEEKELYREQLSAILDYARMLDGLDTEAIPPTASVLPLRNVMRADVAEPSLSPAEVLANAPRQEAGELRVRAIFE